MDPANQPGSLNWRLSAHPITLLCYLGFRIGSLLMYLFGVLFIKNFILVFILTLLLLSIDFYYLKNIAGRRLVGLRWWNEVNTGSGESHWVFESAGEDRRATQNATDKRFFWLTMYIAPACWVGLALLAVLRLQSLIWLVTIGEFVGNPSGGRELMLTTTIVIALILTITNTVAFSRCDKFSQASSFAGSALNFGGGAGGLARSMAGNMVGRIWK